MGGPCLPNLEAYMAMGINPKTKLPVKFDGADGDIKGSIKKFLRLIDEEDAINRYTWFNLPCDLTSQELERMLYYKGQLCFFYNKNDEKFYFMPYALDGQLDFYGRYKRIHPIPLYEGASEATKKALSTLKLDCVYGVKTEEVTEEDIVNSCVLLHDYSKQIPESIIPRQIINDPIIDVMADCIPFMRTNLLASTGVKGMRVQNADESDSVYDASRSLITAARKGEPWIPLVGGVEFQELTEGTIAKASEYMLAMQSLDNFRLSGYGLENGGLFEKKAHVNDAENSVNQSNVGLVMQDGLSIRQNFCNIVNSIYGLGIWCEPSQTQVGDINGDGVEYDNNMEGQSSGVEGGMNDDSTI